MLLRALLLALLLCTSAYAVDIPQSAIVNVVYPSCYLGNCTTYGWPKAFDADTGTMYHSDTVTHPTNLDMQLDATYSLTGIRYDPRDDQWNGRCTSYEFYTSTDGVTWGSAVASGTWANDGNEKSASWSAVNGSYVRFRCLADAQGTWLSAVEITLTQGSGSPAQARPAIMMIPQ